MLESLEMRLHFSVAVAEQENGLLEVSGTEDPDDISISVIGDTVIVEADGETSSYYRVVDVQIDTAGGDDSVAVRLEGATPDVTVNTGDGNDSVTVASVGEAPSGLLSIVLGSGNDTADCSTDISAVSIVAGDGNDTLIGSKGDDALFGDDGDDHIFGMGGSDVIAAGSGENYVSAMGQNSIFIGIEPDPGGDDYAPTIVETYPGFYEITGDWHSDNIAVSISQEQQTFTMNGTTFGNVSFITVNSNGGNDLVNVMSTGIGSIAAAVDAGDGSDNVSTNLDGAIDGGAGADHIVMANAFRGTVYGGPGNDVILLKGDSPECSLFGDDGNDLIDASNSQYGVATRGGAGDDTIYGSPFADALYGEDGNDRVFGLAGSDVIDGGSGSDYLDGGDGNDLFFAGSGWTVVGGSGADTLYAFVLDGSASGVEHIYLRTQ